VQQSVLPVSFPNIPGYTFAALNQPARQVGGDLYFVIDLDENHFGITIADVSDKGMPAALYMALTRSLLLAEAHRSHSPLQVLESVNRLLLELGEPSRFVSVFYGVVEKSSRHLLFTRAGHDRPLLVRDQQILTLQGSGAVLGVLENDEINLSEESILLEPGDRLILYTDGLTDVLDPAGNFFGLERLEKLLAPFGNRPPEDICRLVFQNLVAYQQNSEQFDDMSILTVAVA
jgi:sigma-B regulation protein RsbU (phosphoserine phosphatase)